MLGNKCVFTHDFPFLKPSNFFSTRRCSYDSPRASFSVPPAKVAELSVIIDSAFAFDLPGFASPFLEYLQQEPSAAYSAYCSEVRFRAPVPASHENHPPVHSASTRPTSCPPFYER